MNNVERKRHLAKAVTWRLIASTVTALIALLLGLPLKAVGAVFFIDLFLKFMLYYVHERLWYKHIKYGIKNNDSLHL